VAGENEVEMLHDAGWWQMSDKPKYGDHAVSVRIPADDLARLDAVIADSDDSDPNPNESRSTFIRKALR
jgi:hypothetical protein